MLAIGDALAISLFQLKGFTTEDFLKTHPGGSLGKNKLLKTEDVMRQESSFPNVQADDLLSDVIQLISEKKVGFAVISRDEKPIGMFTDGDLRRALLKNASIKDPIKLWMSSDPLFINENSLAINAAEIMEKNKVSSLIVVDKNLCLRGVVNFQDLLIHKVI
jgi:arabinose-5-phosphate isomerase